VLATQYLSENVHGRVVCSQPRRLAADTLAERVAAEMMTTKQDGVALVSCKGSGGADERRTRIQFCTDFGLLNTLYKDPTLAGVGAVVVDEVHERSVATDLLVALLRRTLALRAAAGKHPFRLILTSATMNEVLFAGYFARKQWDASSPEDGTCAPVLKVGGRTFPVSVHYDSAASSPGQHEKAAEAKALELHARLPASDYAARAMHDILIFQTAPDECERVAKALAERLPDARCVPLHGGLDKDEQREAFEPVDTSRYKRKIVVATNIAEASVTIDGIGVVIDPGVSKQARYDPAKDATVLRVAAVSQASARQRAGRAGRTAPGVCFRLYTREEFEDFDQDSTAELLRADATEAILAVLRQLERQTDWITDVRDFPFVEHPGEARLERALQQLLHLGALASAERGSSSKLTPQGSRMARMRCSPRTSAILFAAQRKGVVVPVAVALGCVPTTVSLFLRGRTEEEKATAERQRKELGARFPELGDIGVGVAVWFETRELSGPEAIAWCKRRGVSARAVRECGKQIGQLLSAGAALLHDSVRDPLSASAGGLRLLVYETLSY
jgi:HrpA-like RNA helicase